jgi:maleamate amidohydrolase
MPQCEADIARYLGGVIDFTVGKQDVCSVGLAAQREHFPTANVTGSLGFATGVFDCASDKLVAHDAPCGAQARGLRLQTTLCINDMFLYHAASRSRKTGTPMETSDLTARQIYQQIKDNPSRARFGFGKKAILVNIDLQKAYTRTDLFNTAYETDPKQLDYVNQLSAAFRTLGWPVVWTHVAYMASGEDCGIWGTRTDTPDSLQNIKFGSERSEFDERLEIDHERDVIYCKKMPSAFFETALQSLCVWHQVDTLVMTGGSTSGCIRATAVDSLSRGYRTIVPEECVADKHESYHFANLTDLAIKYADVVAIAEVLDWLSQQR